MFLLRSVLSQMISSKSAKKMLHSKHWSFIPGIIRTAISPSSSTLSFGCHLQNSMFGQMKPKLGWFWLWLVNKLISKQSAILSNEKTSEVVNQSDTLSPFFPCSQLGDPDKVHNFVTDKLKFKIICLEGKNVATGTAYCEKARWLLGIQKGDFQSKNWRTQKGYTTINARFEWNQSGMV